MHRLIFFTFVLGCAAAQAQGNPDLMKTPECLASRQQLDQVLAKGGPRDRLEQVRQQAAIKCLGVKAGPLPAGRSVPAPVVVDAISLRMESSLTSCDATGCRDAEGGRYNQQGPHLVGPRGICTQQGGSLSCP